MHRIRILEFLGKRVQSDLKTISKNLHIPLNIVRAEVNRLSKEGLVSVEGDKIKISERGIEELQNVKGV